MEGKIMTNPKGYALTQFSHSPGDIMTGIERARSFSRICEGPVSVIISVPQRPGLPGYRIARTFWNPTYEEAVNLH